MTRSRTLPSVAAALALAALAAPGPAAARPHAVSVAVPGPGDLTLMHLEFKRGSARALPRFRGLPAEVRRTLRRARLAVIGSAMRLSRRRVIGTVVLLRKRGGRAAPGAVRVVVSRGVRARVTQRNVLRRRAPGSAGAAQSGMGFACDDAPILPLDTGAHAGFVAYDLGAFRLESDVAYRQKAPELAYDLYCDVYKPDLTPLLGSIGSRFPVSCTFTSTYIGAATDSDGNVVTEPSYMLGMNCSQTIDEVALVLHGAYVNFCEDSADRPCEVRTTTDERDTAVFRYQVRANLDASFFVRGDPPLQRGRRIDLVIDLADGGQIRDDQVM